MKDRLPLSTCRNCLTRLCQGTTELVQREYLGMYHCVEITKYTCSCGLNWEHAGEEEDYNEAANASAHV